MDPNAEHARLNARKWDARAATFDQRRFDYFRWEQRRVIRLADLRPGMHFLDVGCGTGWAVRYAADLLGGEGEFYGVDISGKMIDKALEQASGLSHVHFFVADAAQVPLEGASLDRAICTNSFHHYIDPSKVLAEVCRLLSPGGRFLVLDVTADDLITRWMDHRLRQREPEHVRFYSSREFKELFAQVGLARVKVRVLAYPLKVHIAEKSSI